MLVDLLQDEYKLQKGVKVQIRSLALELESARVALSMLDKMPPELVDEQVRLWARHVRDASYDMADILDYFRARTGDRLFSLSKFKAQREIARAIEDIVKQLREVTELRSRYALHNILGKPEATTPCVPGSSGLLGGGNIMLHYERPPVIITRQLVRVGQPLGMVDMPDLEKWMDFEEERKEPGVLSIIGFGGVGKTTIASALYRKFGSWFERRAMVTLSQVPDFDMVLRSILSQVKGKQQGKGGMGTTLLEEEVPSVLSRAIRRPSSNQAEDVLKKHRQIKAELENHLGQKRYVRWYISFLLLLINCCPLEHNNPCHSTSINARRLWVA
jgi:disease resistance protein RPM1